MSLSIFAKRLIGFNIRALRNKLLQNICRRLVLLASQADFRNYSSVLKFRILIAQSGKIQNQISRKLLRIQKFASYKGFLEIYLVFKNVCLNFLQPILKQLENASFRKF